MKQFIVGLLLATVATLAFGQAPNVTPQTETWLESLTEVDIRLVGRPTATNPAPTVKLFKGVKFSQYHAKNFTFTASCWNAMSVCPPIVGVKVQVFLKLPTGRSNVTRFTGLCGNASECVLPPFPAISAMPGQSYKFSYSRIMAQWNSPPSIQ